MLNKIENVVAKGEIAHHEQFHLWPQCFQKSFIFGLTNLSGLVDASKSGFYSWELWESFSSGLNHLPVIKRLITCYAKLNGRFPKFENICNTAFFNQLSRNHAQNWLSLMITVPSSMMAEHHLRSNISTNIVFIMCVVIIS